MVGWDLILFCMFLEPLGPGGKDLLLIPGKNPSLSVG